MLAEARKKLGMTQAELCARLELPQSLLGEWERRTRAVPRERIPALSEALGLDPAAIEVYSGRLPDEFRDLDPRRVVRALRRMIGPVALDMGAPEASRDPPTTETL